MSHTLFLGHRRIAAGSLVRMALEISHAAAAQDAGMLLLFEDATGRQVDVDTGGSPDEIVARYGAAPASAAASTVNATAITPVADGAPAHRGPGRPRLGVVAREVTLLPHHWEWLSAQPGGASVTLRKLVEHARKAGAHTERTRNAREASYRFLHAVAGNLPDYEEVTRALFAGDLDRMHTLMLPWPADVREYALALATPSAA